MSTEFITVRIGRLPGKIDTIALNGGRTVADAISGAGLTVEAGFEIRVGDDTVGTDKALNDGDTVLLVKKVKGN